MVAHVLEKELILHVNALLDGKGMIVPKVSLLQSTYDFRQN